MGVRAELTVPEVQLSEQVRGLIAATRRRYTESEEARKAASGARFSRRYASVARAGGGVNRGKAGKRVSRDGTAPRRTGLAQRNHYGEFPNPIDYYYLYGSNSDPSGGDIRFTYANGDAVLPWSTRLEDYSVIKVGMGTDWCSVGNYLGNYAGDVYPLMFSRREKQIRRWVKRGGVLVVQNEHTPIGAQSRDWGCGANPETINMYLKEVFGKGMNAEFGYGYYTESAGYSTRRQSLLRGEGESSSPWPVYKVGVHPPGMSPLAGQDLFAAQKGGRTLYVNGDGVPWMNYSKIGRGAVVLASDSNASMKSMAKRPWPGHPSLFESLARLGGHRPKFYGDGDAYSAGA